MRRVRTDDGKVVTFYRKEKEMSKFWESLRNSTISQGLVTVMVVGVSCYLWATGQEVPTQLWTADTFVLGFLFGAKIQQALGR